MRMRDLAILITMAIYSAMCAVPATALWFDPGIPVFTSAEQGHPIRLQYDRVIKIDSLIEYAVVIRDADTTELICDVRSGPFHYRKTVGPVVDKTLAWWVANNPDCRDIKDRPGNYWVATTWTVVRPLGDLLPSWADALVGWIIPPKRVTRQSPLFTVEGK